MTNRRAHQSSRASGISAENDAAEQWLRENDPASKGKRNRKPRQHGRDGMTMKPSKIKKTYSFDPATYATGVHIFCDGACDPNPGAGGWGFVVYVDGVERHSAHGGNPSTTNNVMEMTGALMALWWAFDNLPDRIFQIHCDSQYVVNGSNDWRHGWKKRGWRLPGNKPVKNLDLWKEIDAIRTAMPMKLTWVKGHIWIEGNERADRLAAQGRASGARADEAAKLTVGNLQLGASPSVRLHGKGNKIRICPLWPATATSLASLVTDRDKSDAVFLGRMKEPLTRFGIHRVVTQYAAMASKTVPTLTTKRVSPHTIRHTTAVHLLRAGVDINTIRAWLGHVSLDTTHIYAEVDLEMKAKALAKVDINGLKGPPRQRSLPS
jgi:ribonuclease HI